MSKKVIITGAKHVIEGECKLIIHIPGVEMPLRMNRIKHFIVRKDVIEFYGNSAKAYKITKLIDAQATAKLIEVSIEKRESQLLLGSANFTPQSEIVYPTLAEQFSSYTKEQTQVFRTQLQFDLREWNAAAKGKGLPERFKEDTSLLILACVKYLPRIEKPAVNVSPEVFWKKLIDAENTRTLTPA